MKTLTRPINLLLIFLLLTLSLPTYSQLVDSNHSFSDCELCSIGEQILQDLDEGEFEPAYERALTYIEQDADPQHVGKFCSALTTLLQENPMVFMKHHEELTELLRTAFKEMVENSEVIKSMAQGRPLNFTANHDNLILTEAVLFSENISSVDLYSNHAIIQELLSAESQYLQFRQQGTLPLDTFYSGFMSYIEFLAYGDTRYVDAKISNIDPKIEKLLAAFNRYINSEALENICNKDKEHTRRTYAAIAIYNAMYSAGRVRDFQLIRDNANEILHLTKHSFPRIIYQKVLFDIRSIFPNQKELDNIIGELNKEIFGEMGEIFNLTQAVSTTDWSTIRKDYIAYKEDLINQGCEFAQYAPNLYPKDIPEKDLDNALEYTKKTGELLSLLFFEMISYGVDAQSFLFSCKNMEQFLGVPQGGLIGYSLHLAYILFPQHPTTALNLIETCLPVAESFGAIPYAISEIAQLYYELGEVDLAKQILTHYMLPHFEQTISLEPDQIKGLVYSICHTINLAAEILGEGEKERILSYIDQTIPVIENVEIDDPKTDAWHPDDFKNYHLGELAYSCITLNEYERAERLLAQVTTSSSNKDVAISLEFVYIYLAIKQGRHDEVLARYNHIGTQIKKDPRWQMAPDFYAKLLLSASKKGNYDLLNEFAASFLAQSRVNISRVLLNLKSSSRENYWQGLSKSEEILIEAWRTASQTERGIIPSAIYDWTLMRKGILLFSNNLFSKRLSSHSDSNVQKLYRTYRQAALLLDNQVLASATNLNPIQLRTTTRQLEQNLVTIIRRDYGEEAMQSELLTSWQDIRAALDRKSIAVEFIRFAETDEHEAEYVALMIRKGWKEPKIIPLCTEAQLSRFISFGRGENLRLYNSLKSRELWDLTWGVIEEYIQDGESIYYSTDGLMHQLNLECIRARREEKLYAEQIYDMHRLSSTREVARPSEEVDYRHAALFGNLNYHMDNSMYVRVPSNDDTFIPSRIATLGIAGSSSLPRTHVPESEAMIQEIAHTLSRANIATRTYIWNDGTEEAFKALSGKDNNLLYLYTHGFYIQGETDYQTSEEELPAMMRSGLVLSGSENLELIGGEDGLILAREIADMDLSAVDVAFLSACQTAQGEISSEGVEGIQRGLKQAGVRSIIMTLWEVEAEMSRILSKTFFEELTKPDVTKREAFIRARNKAREEYPDRDWAAFIMLD